MSYTANRTRGAALLADKGQNVTITGDLTSSYDTTTQTATAASSYNKTAAAVILPLGLIQRYGAKKIANSPIVEGDQSMLLSGLDTSGAALPEPPVDAIVTLADGATKMTLVAIDPLAPDGTNIMYDCVVRRQAA